MAINPNARYSGQTTAPSADYPYGGARNQGVPGDNTGTPLEADLVNDIFGFQQALLEEAGIVPSGTPETAAASQYKDALDSIYQRKDTGYQLANIEIIDTAGAGTYTVPAGVRALFVYAVGGGGAGGGAVATGAGQVSGGCGGNAGAVTALWIDAPAASYNYTVGEGGTGVSGANGNNGSSTIFGPMTAGAGGGGNAGSAQTPPRIFGGTALGSASFGFTLMLFSGTGEPTIMLQTSEAASGGLRGRGGQNFFTRGYPGTGFGMGGTAFVNDENSSAQAGSNGADGAIIIEEYV